MKFDKTKFLEWVKKYTNYEELEARAKYSFEGWDIKNPGVFFDKIREISYLAEEVVDLVEKFSRDIDDLSNKEKLELAVSFLDDLVQAGTLLEWADDIAIRLILSNIVQMKNKWLGNDWFVE